MEESDSTGENEVFAIGFGSNYYHQFTNAAVPLQCSQLSSHVDQKNDAKEGKLLIRRPKKNAEGGETFPQGYLFPLQPNGNGDDLNSDNHYHRNISELKQKETLPQRIRRIMHWRRKSRKQKQEGKDDKVHSNNSNPSYNEHSETGTGILTGTASQDLTVVEMSAGCTHNAMISEDGQVYITGTLHGKLFPQITIQRNQIPFKCTQISCGKRHLLALFENKTTMSMGSGYFGQLGHGFNMVNCEELTVIERLSPRCINGEVVRIEAGGMHSAAIVTKDLASWKNKHEKKDIDTTVFRWGTNKFGQCAIDAGTCNAIAYPIPMVEVRNPDTGKKVSFVALSLGKLHSVGLTFHGAVYSWGYTSRCGHGDANYLGGSRKSALKMRNGASVTLPKRIEALKNIKIVQISCGDGHSLALSESGRVFSWGSNSNGQLGVGHTMQIFSPRSVVDLQFELFKSSDFSKEALSKAAENDDTKDVYPIIQTQQIETDTSKSIDLSATVGHIHYPSTPQKKRKPSNHQEVAKMPLHPVITSVHAAGSYSAALSSFGSLYSWGCAEGNQLGHSLPVDNIPIVEPGPLPQTGTGIRIRDARSFDSRLNVLIPRRVECFRKLGLKVDSITTSPHFIVALCSKFHKSALEEDQSYQMGKTLFEREIEKQKKGLSQIRVIRSHP